MDRAVAWYSRILEEPVAEASHEGTIYDVPMQGDVHLTLDSNKQEVTISCEPLFFFWTRDTQAAYQFLRRNDVEGVSQIEDIGSISYVIFKDPDDSLPVVCQPNY